jgi:hypothetical protein
MSWLFFFSGLIFGANNGHLRVVEELLQLGADIEDKSNNGKTALHWACHWGHYPVVKFLVEKGANISTQDVTGMTPLMSATLNKHVVVVKYLLLKGANASVVNHYQTTALMIAKNANHEKLIGILEDHLSQTKGNGECSASSIAKGECQNRKDQHFISIKPFITSADDESPFLVLYKLVMKEMVVFLNILIGESLNFFTYFTETYNFIKSMVFPSSPAFNQPSSLSNAEL